jgi:hypothetical protein
MVAAALSAVPVVEIVRHKATAWPALDRATMQFQLEALGTSITELSDARELLGLPRLSETAPDARWAAHYLLMSSKGREALKDAVAQRATLTEALSTFSRDTLFNARHLLGIRRATHATLRLGELRALFAQARILEIAAE